jgi:hypothetical protein
MDRRTFVAGIVLWAATPQLVAAQAGWVLLGSRTVNWTTGRSSITATRAWGPIGSLSFRVRGGEIFIRDAEVSFVGGGRERIPVNMRLRQNMRSHTVRLRNRNREIRRIDFAFRRVSPGGGARRTTVEVFGRR